MKEVNKPGIEILPHRPPFLFLDRVVSYDKTESVGEVTFGPERDFFKGHFPDYPVVPGVILLEAMAQAAAAGVLVGEESGDYAPTSNILLFAGADEVRFRLQVRPGDTLRTQAKVLRIGHGFAKFQVTGSVDGKVAVEAVIKCMAQRS